MTAATRLIRLEEVATFMGGSTPLRARPQYFGGGIPWVKTTDLNNGLISETEETLTALGLKESSCKMVPATAVLVAMYGGFNQIGRTGLLLKDSAINQALTAIIPEPGKLDPSFLLEWLNYRVDYWKRFAGSSRKDPNITKGDVANFPVPNIPVDQQRASAHILAFWNTAIEKTEKLIEAKEKRFSWLVSRLISGGKHTRGHIRDFTIEVSKRNSVGEIDRVLSVTNNRGFVLPGDQFERRVASSDLSNYKIVTKGQYAYNPSRINVGSIARLGDWDKGVLSPMYGVFKVNEKKVSSDFFLHWLSSHEAKERIRRSAQGSVRETVSFTDFGAIPFPLPLIEQQKVIAETLNTARQEIDLLKKQAEAYRKQKRGLMQKLLTGEWRVKVK